MTRPLLRVLAAGSLAAIVAARPVRGQVIESYVAAFDTAATELLDVAIKANAPANLVSFGASTIQKLREYYAGLTTVNEQAGTLSARVKAGKKYDGGALLGAFGGDAALVQDFESFAINLERFIRTNLPSDLTRLGLPQSNDVWPSFKKWRTQNLIVARKLTDERIARYKVRYGTGESLNFLEVQIDNLFTRAQIFGGSTTLPPTVEPILRFTPLMYSSATRSMTSGVELGLNHYAFSGRTQGLNPVGLSFVLADPNQARIDRAWRSSYRPGVMLHASRNQIAWIAAPHGRSAFLFTRNFSMLLGVL